MSKWTIQDRLEALGANVTWNHLDSLDSLSSLAAIDSLPDELFRASLSDHVIDIRWSADRSCQMVVIANDNWENPVLNHPVNDETDVDTAIYLAATTIFSRSRALRDFPWHGPRYGACERCGWVVLGTDELLTAVDQPTTTTGGQHDNYLYVCPDCLAVAERWRHLLL